MALSEKARERLQDVRDLEPTSNGELRDRWNMDSGRDVARYLRSELGEYTYRDDESRIRVVDDAPDPEPESESDSDTSETGAVTHEQGEASLADPDPSESDGGADEQAETATETTTGETLDLQPVESHDTDRETRDAGGGTSSTGGQQVSLPDDPVTDDRSSDLQPAGSSGSGSGGLRPASGSGGGGDETRAECPECGDVLFRGMEFNALMNDLKRSRKDIRRFLKANQGAAPELACRDIVGCGYYVEDGEARTFNAPKRKRGWGRKLGLGLGAVAMGVGLAASQNDGQGGKTTIDLGGGGGGFGGGNDDSILGGGDNRVV